MYLDVYVWALTCCTGHQSKGSSALTRKMIPSACFRSAVETMSVISTVGPSIISKPAFSVCEPAIPMHTFGGHVSGNRNTHGPTHDCAQPFKSQGSKYMCMFRAPLGGFEARQFVFWCRCAIRSMQLKLCRDESMIRHSTNKVTRI